MKLAARQIELLLPAHCHRETGLHGLPAPVGHSVWVGVVLGSTRALAAKKAKALNSRTTAHGARGKPSRRNSWGRLRDDCFCGLLDTERKREGLNEPKGDPESGEYESIISENVEWLICEARWSATGGKLGACANSSQSPKLLFYLTKSLEHLQDSPRWEVAEPQHKERSSFMTDTSVAIN